MFLSKFKREPLLWLLLAITVFLQFYRLSIGELQAWDESLYVVRAKACLEFGSWLDQTQYAVGGLYSSTHPPLGIWAMAGFVAILGESVLIWRLFAALSAVLGLFFLYRISLSYTSERTSLLAVIMLGNAQHYLWFGHHAQLDIPMHAAVIGTIWFTMKALRSHYYRHYLLGGLSLAAALLIKAFQGLYVLPLLFLLFLSAKIRQRFIKFTAVVVIGLLFAGAWYAFMMQEHGIYFTNYLTLVSRLGSGAYFSFKSGNWWYYLNQLILSVPFFFPLLFAGLLSKKLDRYIISAVVWTVLMFILLTVMGTKMGHFVLFAVIPAVVALPGLIEEFALSNRKRWINYVVYPALVICTIWSLGIEVRNPGLFATGMFKVNTVLMLAIGLPFLISWYFLTRKRSGFERIMLLLATFIVAGNLYRWTNRTDAAYDRGASETSAFLDSMQVSNLLVLHSGDEFDSMQPQLAYYTNGWTLGWRSDKTYRSYSWYDIDSISLMNEFGAVVVHLPWDVFSKPSAEDSLALVNVDMRLRSRFTGYLKFGQYAVYY